MKEKNIILLISFIVPSKTSLIKSISCANHFRIELIISWQASGISGAKSFSLHPGILLSVSPDLQLQFYSNKYHWEILRHSTRLYDTRPIVFLKQLQLFFSRNRFRRAMAKQYVKMAWEMIFDVKKMKNGKNEGF